MINMPSILEWVKIVTSSGATLVRCLTIERSSVLTAVAPYINSPLAGPPVGEVGSGLSFPSWQVTSGSIVRSAEGRRAMSTDAKLCPPETEWTKHAEQSE